MKVRALVFALMCVLCLCVHNTHGRWSPEILKIDTRQIDRQTDKIVLTRLTAHRHIIDAINISPFNEPSDIVLWSGTHGTEQCIVRRGHAFCAFPWYQRFEQQLYMIPYLPLVCATPTSPIIYLPNANVTYSTVVHGYAHTRTLANHTTVTIREWFVHVNGTDRAELCANTFETPWEPRGGKYFDHGNRLLISNPQLALYFFCTFTIVSALIRGK